MGLVRTQATTVNETDVNEKNTSTSEQDDRQGVLPLMDDETPDREIVREKMLDAMTPGFQVEFGPDEADLAGAFVEDALSEQDAIESSEDLADGVPGSLDS